MTRRENHKTVGGGAAGTFELPAPAGPVVMRQSWRDLVFLHWPVPAAVVQSTLPDGLGVDTFDDGAGSGPQAFVGIVPFLMEKVRPRFCPPVPGVSWFGELNLRTYVIGPDGSPGVWFYSLDADQRLAVWLARKFFALPYHHAKIRQDERPDPGRGRQLSYRWRRSTPGQTRRGPIKGTRRRRRPVRDGQRSALPDQPSFVYHAPPTRQAQTAVPGTLAHWLVERYLLYSRRPLFVPGPGHTAPPATPEAGLYVGRVEHAAYRIAEVPLDRFDASLFELNGFDRPTGPPVHALWSPGVDVEIYPLRKVCARHTG